jgi:hypothetical protein
MFPVAAMWAVPGLYRRHVRRFPEPRSKQPIQSRRWILVASTPLGVHQEPASFWPFCAGFAVLRAAAETVVYEPAR